MKHSVDIKWLENMVFETEVNGFKLTLDAAENNGGSNRGPRPKPLLLVALGGCTAMDVVSLLKKMRVEHESLNVKVEGDVQDEHPMLFTHLHIIYEIKGTNLEAQMDKIQKAVNLSQERYCGVAATLRKGIEITYEIKLL